MILSARDSQPVKYTDNFLIVSTLHRKNKVLRTLPGTAVRAAHAGGPYPHRNIRAAFAVEAGLREWRPKMQDRRMLSDAGTGGIISRG